MYYIGEIETHEVVRRVINDLKVEIKALEVKIKEKLRSKFVISMFLSFSFTINVRIFRHQH